MGTVVFDYSRWQFRYPELARVPPGTAAAYFAEAGMYLDNSGRSPACDDTKRALILNMLTAHIAKLNFPLDGQPSSDLVGRISGASEGSVSVSTDLQVPGTAAWFAQTKYGLSAWQAMAGMRTFHYFGAPRRRW